LQRGFPPQSRPNPRPVSAKRCFKCQGLGHIAADCLKQKVITLAEWEVVKEEEKEVEPKEDLKEKEEESQEDV